MLPKSVTPSRIAANFTGALAATKALDATEFASLDGRAADGKQKRSVSFCVSLAVLIPHCSVHAFFPIVHHVLQVHHTSVAYVSCSTLLARF